MKRAFRHTGISLHCALAFAAMGGGTAIAQEVPAAVPGQADDIIVTVTKRRESIHEIPMSIYAISGDQLTQRGITSVGDLQKVVAGFTFTESYSGTPIYYIRGVGFNESSLGAAPNVSVYVDEIPLPFPVMSAGVALDLQRVEVLKGPQGTLFGQNSTGGAVNYIAAKPSADFSSSIKLGYGSFNERSAGGYVTGPLTNTLNARLAFKTERRAPSQFSPATGKELGRIDKSAARLMLDWQAGSDLKVALNLNGNEDKSELRSAQFVSVNFLQNATAALLPPAIKSQIQHYQPPGMDNRAADWGPGTPKQDNWMTQAASRIDYNLAGDTQLSYLVSRAHFRMQRLSDTDGMVLNNFDVTTKGEISSNTHELRLGGKSLGRQLKWLVGANYEKSTVDQLDHLKLDDASNSYGLALASKNPAAYFNTTDNASNQQFRSKAIFAALDYDITPTVVGHLAARRTQSRVDFVGCTRDSGDGVLANAYNTYLHRQAIPVGGCITATPAFVFGPVAQTLEEQNTSWRTGLDWKIADRTLLYLNISKGYKGGSFPNLSASESTQYKPVTQESLISYEGGWKVYFKEQKLQLNGAVFHYDYTDKQVRGRVPTKLFGPLEALVNVPKSTVDGVELEAQWKPAPGWAAGLNAARLDTKIKDNFTNFDDFGVSRNFGGQPFPNTPKLSGNADLQYNWSLKDGKNIFVGANVSYQGETFNGLGQNERLKIDAYSTMDIRAGIDAADGSWKLAFWAANLTNKYYWTSQSRVVDTIVRMAGKPRAFGTNFTYNF